ncbi:MAG TPA: methylated-DNA--[protein]-cysteine S-methyltransferase [Steroidobacteraceae bacterium]|nr:methylated-DNA--[protein]-cysteine S-methyltransferase [Steroidobacteraceae bacterium]
MSERFYSERFDTPTGWMIVITDDQQRLRAAEWEDKETRLERLLRLRYGETLQLQEARRDSEAKQAIEAYFSGDLTAIERLRTRTYGTDFQRAVWAALRTIPAGTTVSYGELAVRIGRPTAVRAVGAANGANPIPVVVPCHRVIGADSSLTGFGGGLERKQWLLTHERRHTTASVPYNLELRI